VSRIERLANDLANQIAAGEVVERPASIAKELVENALDAGASRVDVAIELGGLGLVEVADDGSGMDAADALLALERHATSKIRRVEDLARIGTFGFRGEALPSIASVSKLTLVTRDAASDAATQVFVNGGGEPAVTAAARAVGTTVSVRALFWNVPARRKFLKSVSAESAAVGEVVLVAALARPDVAFHLLRDGKTARKHVQVATLGERVRDVLADDTLAPLEGERGSVRMRAWLSAPERARAGATGLFCFVNGRPVRDRHLTRAIQQAYGSVLEPGRYPTGAFFLEVPASEVDVNVHPQKAEVRFAEGRAVYEAVARALHLPLAGAFNLPVGGPLFRRPLSSAGIEAAAAAPEGPSTKEAPRHGWAFDPPDAGIDSTTKPAIGGDAGGAGSADPWGFGPAAEPREAPTLSADEVAAGMLLRDRDHDSEPPPGTVRTVPPAYRAVDAPAPRVDVHGALFDDAKGFYAQLRYVGQVKRMFLLCEGADGLYVLDQHAAAERVTFDRLRKAYAGGGGVVASQPLLIPAVFPASPAEVAAAEAIEEANLPFGLELGPHGPAAIAVRAVPAMLKRVAPEVLARDLVAEYMLEAQRPFADRLDMVFATMACHGSLRGGDAVSEGEARALLDSLDGVDFGGHCPHGRPVVTRLSFSELERRVGRP
jgi:DNA mismatch repair protein MutL